MNNKFSLNLKKIRRDNNLSQEELADELGVSRQAISKWESGSAYPEMEKIITLCEKFNLNIDDLLYKDIREVKGEEESKRNLNKYVDDFLNFITNSINMFSNMSFKSKCKCLFEQVIIGILLLIICLIIGIFGQELIYIMHGIIPDKLFYFLYTIFRLLYSIFAVITSILIIVHIFKTRYLNYYEKIREDVIIEKADNKNIDKEEKNKKDNKIDLNKNEEKIIIRDPKHSEYKFINGLFRVIVGMIKFFTLCLLIVFFLTLICLFCAFIISFLAYKTGLFFIGLLLLILFAGIINIIFILLLLNFVFNRKNDKKKIIYTFIVSLIMIGISSGLLLVGALDFEYIENNKDILKTEYIEIDMRNDLMFDSYLEIEYIESNNENIKIEYTINKYCNINYSNLSNSIVHLWGICDNPIKLVKEVISNFNNKKIVSINNQLQNVKVYTTKENIDILKKNYKDYTDVEVQHQNTINSYEKEINELQNKLDEYVQKEWEYQEEINNLKNQLFMYESNDE